MCVPESPNCSCLELFSNNPSSWTCVKVVSWLSPKLTTAPSAKNKSDHSSAAVPSAFPSETPGANPVVVILTSVLPAILISTVSSVFALILVSASKSNMSSLAFKSTSDVLVNARSYPLCSCYIYMLS